MVPAGLLSGHHSLGTDGEEAVGTSLGGTSAEVGDGQTNRIGEVGLQGDVCLQGAPETPRERTVELPRIRRATWCCQTPSSVAGSSCFAQ